MSWWEPVIAFAVPATFGILVALGAEIRNRIAWNRMKARHRGEWEAMQCRTESMFKSLEEKRIIREDKP